MTTKPTPENPAGISRLDYYRVMRGQIEHEDNLNSQRLSFFVASQSFLFTAFAIVLSNVQPGRLAWVQQEQSLLLRLIPIVSIAATVLIYATILAGTAAIVSLRRHYATHQPGDEALPPVQGYRLTQVFGQAAPLVVPPIFVGIWLVLLIRHLR